MKPVSRATGPILALCSVLAIAGPCYRSVAQDDPNPLAPLVSPKKAKQDFWIGEVTVTRKIDDRYHRDGLITASHALATGDRRYIEDQTTYEFYDAKITGDCADPSNRSECAGRTFSGEVEYRRTENTNSRATTPRACRAGRKGVISEKESKGSSATMQGAVAARFEVSWHSEAGSQGPPGWYVSFDVFEQKLGCERTLHRSHEYDQGCDSTPVTETPPPTKERCLRSTTTDQFFTGITDPDALRLKDTKWMEPRIKDKPDNGMEGRVKRTGTITREYVVTYDLERILLY